MREVEIRHEEAKAKNLAEKTFDWSNELSCEITKQLLNGSLSFLQPENSTEIVLLDICLWVFKAL